MKALTEKLYWIPGVRLDSTIVVVVVSVVFMRMSLSEDDCCSSYNQTTPLGCWGDSHVSVTLSLRTPPGVKVRLRGAEGAE